jgi:pSer/pThr/pTyr-binding forkhead associated (FHA) protein
MVRDPRFVLERIADGLRIPISGVMSVGRSEQSALRITDGKPSRFHAEIVIDGDEACVRDVGSKNGTFINETRLAGGVARKLRPGDRVRFDICAFVFRERPAAFPETSETDARSRHADTLLQRKDRRPRAWLEDVIDQKTRWVPAMSNAVSERSRDQSDSPLLTPTLYVTSGSDAGSAFELGVGGSRRRSWTIGRQDDRDICFDDEGVSAIHATLIRDSGRWMLFDDFSKNGTYVNGTRFWKCYLGDEYKIKFGTVACVFRLPPTEVASGTARLGRPLISREWLRRWLAHWRFR